MRQIWNKSKHISEIWHKMILYLLIVIETALIFPIISLSLFLSFFVGVLVIQNHDCLYLSLWKLIGNGKKNDMTAPPKVQPLLKKIDQLLVWDYAFRTISGIFLGEKTSLVLPKLGVFTHVHISITVSSNASKLKNVPCGGVIKCAEGHSDRSNSWWIGKISI